ncbi:MAG TPA: hypothetical protein VNF46_05775, partial [Gammaproteobacteria bacterium]|nr:hypothetical protein [Gammaproteobacteria bacterium]
MVPQSYVPGVGDLPKQGGYTSTDSLGQTTAQDITNLGSLIAGEDQLNNLTVVEQRYQAVEITTNTTTVVKGSGGFLKGIVIGTVGTSETLAIYNNTTAAAPRIALITPTAPGF